MCLTCQILIFFRLDIPNKRINPMSEVVPGLAQARAMLGNIDSSKMIVGSVSVLVVLGAIYAISSDRLAGDQVPLNPKQVSTNLARVGSVTLVQPPAPPPVAKPAPVAEAPVEPVADEGAPAVEAVEPVAVDAASAGDPAEAAPAVEAVEPVAAEGAPAVEAVEPVAAELVPAVEPVATEAAPVMEAVEPVAAETVESAPVSAEPESAQPVEIAPAPIVTAPAARPQPQWMMHMAPLRAPQR
ncbi:hypothetical protein CCR95_16125 [Thiocystis minor]|nr:hypothetical protein [Thiocystis minor]